MLGQGTLRIYTDRILNSEAHSWAPLGDNIQDAIDDLPAEGGSIWIPARTMTPTAQLTDAGVSRLKMVGCGEASRIVAPNGLNDDLFEITSLEELILRDFVLDHDKTNQTAGSALRLSLVDNFLLERVGAVNGYWYGFDVSACSRGEIKSCVGDAARDDCLSLTAASNRISVIGGEYMNAAGTANPNGIEIENGCYDISLISPRCHNNMAGLQIFTDAGEDPVHDITVESIISYLNDYGVRIQTLNGALGNTNHISIQNPNLRNNVSQGLDVDGFDATFLVEDVDISGGFSKDNGGYGLRVNAAKNVHSRNCDLSGNTLGPFSKVAPTYNCFVGQPYAWLYNMFMKQGGHAERTLAVAGRVYLVPIELEEGTVMDALAFAVRGTAAGNVILGMYHDSGAIAPKTPAGGALIAETPSTAVAGTFRVQEIEVTDAWLPPGLYWVAIESDGTTLTVTGHGDGEMDTGGTLRTYYYDRDGGYGALADPCPAVTLMSVIPDYVFLRAKV